MKLQLHRLLPNPPSSTAVMLSVIRAFCMHITVSGAHSSHRPVGDDTQICWMKPIQHPLFRLYKGGVFKQVQMVGIFPELSQWKAP